MPVDRRWPFADIVGKTLLYIIAGAILFLLLISPVLAYRSVFYRRLWSVIRTDNASRVYDKMCALATMVKLGPKPQQTPLEYTTELSSRFPSQASDIDDIARTYVENRFGRRGRLGLFEEAKLLKARRAVYDTLLKQLNFFRRIFPIR